MLLQQIHIAAKTARELGLPVPEGHSFLVLYEVRVAQASTGGKLAAEESEDEAEDFDIALLPPALRRAVERYAEDRAALLEQLRAQAASIDEGRRQLGALSDSLQRQVEQAAAAEKELRLQLVEAQQALQPLQRQVEQAAAAEKELRLQLVEAQQALQPLPPAPAAAPAPVPPASTPLAPAQQPQKPAGKRA